MANKATEALTTKDLRATLFQAIDDVRAKKISASDATAITKLSAEIIKTADLEMRYASILERLDSGDSGIAPGPLLLAEKKG